MIRLSMSLPTLLGRIRIFLLNAFWIVPAAAAVLAVFVARWVSTMDYTTPIRFGGLMTTSGPAGARDMVQTVATSSLTVVTLVFSIMIVVLQMAGSQYSPRLPAQFLRDTTTQIVLGVFVFTFVYSLSIVRSIGAASDFVPNFAVTTCFIAVICCVAAFIHFIHHIVHSMRVEMVLSHVRRETVRTLRRLRRQPGKDTEFGDPPRIPDGAVPLASPLVGTIQGIDGANLVECASEMGVVICFCVRQGESLAEGPPLAWVWRSEGNAPPENIEIIGDSLRSILQLGDERTFQEDFGFGFTQLVDIALRALSPAVNDPTTACMAIGSLDVVMNELARGDPGTRLFRDAGGTVRVVVPERSFAEILGSCVGPICQAAPVDIWVMSALVGMLHNLAYAAKGDEQRTAVAAQITRVHNLCLAEMTDETDRFTLEVAVKEARRALAGEPPIYP